MRVSLRVTDRTCGKPDSEEKPEEKKIPELQKTEAAKRPELRENEIWKTRSIETWRKMKKQKQLEA